MTISAALCLALLASGIMVDAGSFGRKRVLHKHSLTHQLERAFRTVPSMFDDIELDRELQIGSFSMSLSYAPSEFPSAVPSGYPSGEPSSIPSSIPTVATSVTPSTAPVTSVPVTPAPTESLEPSASSFPTTVVPVPSEEAPSQPADAPSTQGVEPASDAVGPNTAENKSVQTDGEGDNNVASTVNGSENDNDHSPDSSILSAWTIGSVLAMSAGCLMAVAAYVRNKRQQATPKVLEEDPSLAPPSIAGVSLFSVERGDGVSVLTGASNA